MSVLPEGRGLSRFLPNVAELLENPSAYLEAEPVRIGPRRMYGLAAVFGLAGAACLAACPLTGVWTGERVAMGIGLLLGAAVWLGWSLMMRGHSLLLRPDGLEVRHFDTVVFCPWALFNVEGSPHTPDLDSPRIGLTLPIDPEMAPFIELRRHDSLVAHGAEVSVPQLRFTGPDAVMLPARYEVQADDLGFLLLHLGQRLGHIRPRGLPPPEAFGVPEEPTISEAPDEAGWITVPLTRLRFPARCCDCGEPTHAALPVQVDSRSGFLLGFLDMNPTSLVLTVPTCEECQAEMLAHQRAGGARGMRLGALFLLVVAALVAFAQEGDAAGGLFLLGLGATALGGLLGFVIGTSVSRRMPVEARRYDPKRGTLHLRFVNPDYAPQVLDATRKPPHEN